MVETMGTTDSVMTWADVIQSNGVLNMKLARLALSGMTALGLIIVPGSHKLAIVRVSRTEEDLNGAGQLSVDHYKDPGDPCFYTSLEPATGDVLVALHNLSRQQLRAFLDGRS